MTATPTSDSSIELTWDESENALGYNIYRDGYLVANVTGTSYSDGNLDSSTEYCYAITAAHNKTETDKSEEACATTFDLQITTPENLVATPTSISSIELTWNETEKALGYNIYRDGDLLTNITETSYSDENLNSYTEYCYAITAVRNETETDKSEEVCTTTFDLPITTPENLIATPTSASSISLSWDEVEKALSYNVYRDGDSIANVTNPTYTDVDLEYNTEYCYIVTAVRGDEESEESDEECVKTLGESIEELSLSINIYPNPVENELFLATEVSVEEIAIYDVYGRQIMSQQVNETASQQVVEVADLEAGVYFVKVVTNEGEIVKRFVKK